MIEMAKHKCEMDNESGDYGAAIESCIEYDDDGRFWVGNGEYSSQVAFCPVCGAKAPTPPLPRVKGGV
jgi:hypothetical protein